MPVATSWSAASRMSLSVTLPAKKFQLFQPIGGVRATCDEAGLAVGATAVCDAPVKDARARAAIESETKMRMRIPLGNDFRVNSIPLASYPAICPSGISDSTNGRVQ